MGLTRINDSTAKDDKYVYFKKIYKSPHRDFPTCPKCNRRVDVIWIAWPNSELYWCENCIEWEDTNESQG